MHKESIAPGASITLTAQNLEAPLRIDTFLANHFESYSRSYFKKCIDQKKIMVNGQAVSKPSHLIHNEDTVIITFPEQPIFYTPKEIPKDIEIQLLFEHPDFLIIGKGAHINVHAPAPDFPEVTVVDWLLNKYKEIQKVGEEDRPGIVHRLDKDTSGLLIIPRTNLAHNRFSDLFKNREIHKTYLALVEGHPPKTGTIDYPIARDAVPIKMTHKKSDGKSALTNYKVLEYFDEGALVELKPVTGRTHQLRVHCAAIGHPIIGDIVYGKKSKFIKRQALHAHKLDFIYNEKPYDFELELPEDFAKAKKSLEVRTKKNT